MYPPGPGEVGKFTEISLEVTLAVKEEFSTRSVPFTTVVGPVKVLLPDRVTVLLLLLVKPPPPEMLPDNTMFSATAMFVPIESWALVTASKVTTDPGANWILFVMVRTWVELVERVEARRMAVPLPEVLVKIKSPLPKAWSFPTAKAALVRTTVPPV